jgi:chemotaxis protein MotA
MLNGVGLIIVLVCVFGSFIISGGKFEIILHALPHEMMAIVGASIGAFIVANSMATVKKAGKESCALSRAVAGRPRTIGTC